MTKKTVLCTGAAGFIGSWICEALCQEGYEVVAIDDLSGGSMQNVLDQKYTNYRWEKMDLNDTGLLGRKLVYYKPEIVYHCAANARESASFFQPVSITQRNMMAYANLLRAGILAGVKRYIVFSSIAVYGHQTPPFHELMTPKPVDLYGLQKLHMEETTKMMAACHDFEFVILRPHNVFGPRQSISDPYRNVIGIWLNQAMRGEQLTVFGDGSQKRAFSYIEESLGCYLQAMHVPSGGVYNIGSDYHITVRELADKVRGHFDPAPDLDIQPYRWNEVYQAYCDHTRAKTELGLLESEPAILDFGISEMVKWAKDQGPHDWRHGDRLEIITEKVPKKWIATRLEGNS